MVVVELDEVDEVESGRGLARFGDRHGPVELDAPAIR
jgi:hypothetical protein